MPADSTFNSPGPMLCSQRMKVLACLIAVAQQVRTARVPPPFFFHRAPRAARRTAAVLT